MNCPLWQQTSYTTLFEFCGDTVLQAPGKKLMIKSVGSHHGQFHHHCCYSYWWRWWLTDALWVTLIIRLLLHFVLMGSYSFFLMLQGWWGIEGICQFWSQCVVTWDKVYSRWNFPRGKHYHESWISCCWVSVCDGNCIFIQVRPFCFKLNPSRKW